MQKNYFENAEKNYLVKSKFQQKHQFVMPYTLSNCTAAHLAQSYTLHLNTAPIGGVSPVQNVVK